MELINWSLSAIDKIFSPRSGGVGEPVCPDGTSPAGYCQDPWGKWRVVCLAMLSVEDIEDIYIFGLMMAGFALIGMGALQIYRKIGKLAVGLQTTNEILVSLKAVSERVAGLQLEIERTNGLLKDLAERALDGHKRLDYVAGQISDTARVAAGLNTRVEEMWRDLTSLKFKMNAAGAPDEGN